MPDYPPTQPMEEILASIKRIIAEDAPVGQGASVDDQPLELGSADAGTPSPPAAAAPASDLDGLLSASSQAASRQALAALSAVTIDPHADANTLDGLVRELLRPMLKAWLDENLPTVVERMVAREIARLGR
jgi:uncharacterized protein